MVPVAGRSLNEARHSILGVQRCRCLQPDRCFGWIVAGVFSATTAFAQDLVTTPPDATTDEASIGSLRVQVNLVGAVGADAELRQLLEEWLGANDIDYVIARPARLRAEDVKSPRSDGPPVRMWVVAVGKDRARLYFAEPDSSRYLVRDVPVPSGFDEVGRERIVQIVLASALAFIEEGASSSLEEVERSMTDVAGEPSAETPPKPAAVESAEFRRRPPPVPSPQSVGWCTELGVGIGYGATTQASAGIAHGPGARLAVARATDDLGFSLSVLGQYRPTRSVRTDRVRLELRDLVLAGGLGVELGLTGPVSWQTQIGAGMRLIHVAPRPRTADVVVSDRLRDARVLWFLGFGPRWNFGEASFAVQTRLDVEPVGVRYELESGGDRIAELTVPHFQPGLFLDAGWHRSVGAARATPQ